ncbi:MAG TPA: hypothetical protein VJ911_00175 [Cryomorphaceae bacterium]|nr:hypothetical protein [Cryomorphaceae bacterium]
MKKILVFLAVLLLLVSAAGLIYHEEVPKGEKGERAEALTDKMWEAIGKNAWDSLPFISWTFNRQNNYVWDKRNHQGSIAWDDYLVKLDLNSLEGIAFKGDKQLNGDAKKEAIDEAWKLWCNDSFWLNAPAKARDRGTERYFLKRNGRDALLVQYTSGGVTPGDAYLWVLDENGLPEYYKMWVSIIPVGGVKATWAEWKEMNGAMIATEHKIGPVNVGISDLKSGEKPTDVGIDENYFAQLD